MDTSRKVKYIVGIDEVGRGPLAGPTTVCVFAVEKTKMKHLESIGAKDSKQLSEQKRDVISKQLRDLNRAGHCHFAIVSSSSHMIDRKGINKAISVALISGLKKIEEKLGTHPGHLDIYLDGGLSAGKRYFRQHTIIKGDASVPVIACASILAKVHRDKLMDDYDLKFPAYGFLNHKGYGTPEHYKAIRKHGMTTIHRRSFLKEIIDLSENKKTF